MEIKLPPLPKGSSALDWGGRDTGPCLYRDDEVVAYARSAVEADRALPIDMVLHCPTCHAQHIDAPDVLPMTYAIGAAYFSPEYKYWTNPPHRSHLCHACGHIWRPADVPTNGVAAIKTKGKADFPGRACSTAAQEKP